MLVGHSVTGDYFLDVPLPGVTKGAVRPDCSIVMFIIQPLQDGRVFFRLVSNFDPKLKAIPYWLLNWFNRKFAKVLFKRIAKKARSLVGTAYEERWNDPEKKVFYDYIDETLLEMNLS